MLSNNHYQHIRILSIKHFEKKKKKKKIVFLLPGTPGSRRRVRLGDPGTPGSRTTRVNTFYNVLLLYENNNIVLYQQANCYMVGGMLREARPL